MNSTPIAGAAWMTKKAMNEVLGKAARSLGLATLAVERGDRQAVLTELATVEVEMARVRAALADARNADLPEFARFFGCPAEFGRAVDQGAASDMLEFSNAAVTAPLLTADPTLLKALEPFCDVGAKARRTASNTLRAAVEKEVEKLLPHGKAQKRTVAKALAMSTRTLARRLAVQETTYEEVLDQLRCSLALQHLKDPGMSLSQIAWQLGYEESTSFNHAFRRWTGRSPSEVRKRKSLPAAA
jgi:AraC-like DNA-binding protein